MLRDIQKYRKKELSTMFSKIYEQKFVLFVSFASVIPTIATEIETMNFSLYFIWRFAFTFTSTDRPGLVHYVD